MNKHTPGPWTYFYKNKYDEHHVSLPLIGQSMRLGLFEDGCPTENPEADARLIAAAPDLLEAMQAMLSEFNESMTGIVHDELAVIAKARAAIAKATQ